MVGIDRLSKFVHFIPVKHDFNNKQVVDNFVSHVIKLRGFSKWIISHRDKIFINKFWQQLFKSQGTTQAVSSSYHLQMMAKVKFLIKHLRCT